MLSHTYDDADQMLTVGATSYDYDNSGNQVERGSGIGDVKSLAGQVGGASAHARCEQRAQLR